MSLRHSLSVLALAGAMDGIYNANSHNFFPEAGTPHRSWGFMSRELCPGGIVGCSGALHSSPSWPRPGMPLA